MVRKSRQQSMIVPHCQCKAKTKLIPNEVQVQVQMKIIEKYLKKVKLTSKLCC